ncbi:hypothetical protein WJX81_008376 [Elliptochloris bilobata]|uniref:HTH cro/C1-type domain-containing protein n=1 Tax=Elliptochloris bilobata TaxID=381761 RepID=A0AAW1QX74_9CHLO
MGERKYAVLVCGSMDDEIEQRFGHAGVLYEKLLSGPGEAWTCFFPCDGQAISNGDLEGFSGIAVTGSASDSFSDEPWIADLRRLLAAAVQRGQRVLGMCFGCQVVAVALQGTAGRGEVGFEVGVRRITFRSGAAAAAPRQCEDAVKELERHSSVAIHEVHQDGVRRLPADAELLASSRHCSVEVWSLGDNVLCIQGHVEFNAEFMAALLALRERQNRLPLPAALAAKARTEGQDWDTVVIRKKAPTAGAARDKSAVAAAVRSGAEVETMKKFSAGSNRAATGAPKDAAKLDRETEELHHERVPSELKKQIMAARLAKKLTQAQLAQTINEKPQVIQEYESGKAIPSPQILSKLSRALGTTLSAKKAAAKK